MPQDKYDTDAFHDITHEALSDARIGDTDAPIAAVDAAHEAHEAVLDMLAVSATIENRLADLKDQRIHMTRDGHDLLKREAIEEAKSVAADTQRTFDRAYRTAEAEVLRSALPRFESEGRESLARQEFLLALGDAQGNDVASRVLGLARSGSPEVQAVLGTPFARTALIARGAANIDRVLVDAQKAVAHTGATPEALRARDALGRLGKLSGAQAAASRAFNYSLG
jgi:hypothetical protein